MNCWTCRILCLAGCFTGIRLNAEVISWFSDAYQTNLTSAGAPMDAGFQFELGVFSAGFAPTQLNVSQWSSHWVAADSTSYNATTHRFTDQWTVTNNISPFLVGATAWIFGHRTTPTGTERILLRHTTWTWPAPDPMNPLPTEWNVGTANQVVLGNVGSSGSPFLMKSARSQTFTQWQVELLTGEPLAGPGDDPDGDGSSNLLEFIFGTPPKSAGPATVTPVALVAGHAQITIPRRPDRPARLTVEVSGNLSDWQSGPAATQLVDDGVAAMIVRDLVPLDPVHPRRFMRINVEPAAP